MNVSSRIRWRRLGFSVAVVTAVNGREELGRTVTSFLPLSSFPPRLIVSIDAHSRLVDFARAARSFSISFLSSDQDHVADAFAGKQGNNDRFSVAAWRRWPSGNRRLEHASVALDCELAAAIDVGDHILLVGSVIEAKDAEGVMTFLWGDRSYGRFYGR
ncbi:MAG TPA: flavin reductase family protein [Ensifer sp.]|nr:flavin reductase family protein [Ensifer sp.]